MTLATLKAFGIGGIEIPESGTGSVINVKGGQTYKAPSEYKVEGDWSNASFFLAADLLSGGQPVCVAPGTDPDLIPENEEERLLVYGLTNSFIEF